MTVLLDASLHAVLAFPAKSPLEGPGFSSQLLQKSKRIGELFLLLAFIKVEPLGVEPNEKSHGEEEVINILFQRRLLQGHFPCKVQKM